MREKKEKKQEKLYLSDRPPLGPAGKIGLAISYILIAAWAVAIIWPLTLMVISSFNGNQGKNISMTSDFVFSLKNFRYLFEKTYFADWVKNTIVIAGCTAFLTLLMVSLTGYAYSRYHFKGKKASLMTILLIQSIPTFAGITAYYTMHSILNAAMPFFTRQALLILIYTGGGIASNTYILKGYIDSISSELDEAARIDGCSNYQIYRLIIMPIARPMLAIIALWSFIGPFMDFMMPQILLTSPKEYTLATGLFSLIRDTRTMNQPAFAAGGLLTAIPIIILFISLQGQLVSGLSQGSVKG